MVKQMAKTTTIEYFKRRIIDKYHLGETVVEFFGVGNNSDVSCILAENELTDAQETWITNWFYEHAAKSADLADWHTHYTGSLIIYADGTHEVEYNDENNSTEAALAPVVFVPSFNYFKDYIINVLDLGETIIQFIGVSSSPTNGCIVGGEIMSIKSQVSLDDAKEEWIRQWFMSYSYDVEELYDWRNWHSGKLTIRADGSHNLSGFLRRLLPFGEVSLDEILMANGFENVVFDAGA